MKISIVGTGYVGLVAGVCFADAGHNVICVDRDESKIKLLRDGSIPIYEPGLQDLMKQAASRLTFTMDIASAVQAANVIFIAVATPEKEDGSADLTATWSVAEAICKLASEEKFLVLKSTVPIGTADRLREQVARWSEYPIHIINNPEFLKEGAAIDDFLKPDRVVIGCNSPKAEKVMREIYAPFVKNGNPILFMDNASAEMTKYAANSFLALKISFINELALLADKVGADINQVRKGFTSDRRINPAFFHPGVGYGGSCFPKDVKALVHTGRQMGIDMSLVNTADEVNDRQKLVLFEKMLSHFGSLQGRKIAMWGLAFKPRTDDIREAPALLLIEKLVAAGANVTAYDPVASANAVQACKARFAVAPSALAAVEGADALAIVTEWNEFRSTDLVQLKSLMKAPQIFDGRNIFDPVAAREAGFAYYCIGRQMLSR